jgi:hypothetical protein
MKNTILARFAHAPLVRIFGIIALTAVIVFTMAACDPGPDDDNGGNNNGTTYVKLDPADITITIKNTLTGDYAADIKEVRVSADRGGGEWVDLINDNYIVESNGMPVTLPKITVPVEPGYSYSDDMYTFYVRAFVLPVNRYKDDLVSAPFYYNKNNLPSTLTLDLNYNWSTDRWVLTE